MVFNKITRRQALKSIIATSGGLAAAAFIPSRWLKPMVMSGVLPVHAQTSSGYTSINPAESRDFDGGNSGQHWVSAMPYIFHNFNSLDFAASDITAQLIGSNVSGVTVVMDIANIVGTVQVLAMGNVSLPISKTADTNGVAHFPLLMPQHVVQNSTFDLSFTYSRGGNILHVDLVHFYVDFSN